MDTPSPKNTLDQLRSRSWEMELLLSGFVLVLLLPVPEFLNQQAQTRLTNLNVSALQQILTLGVVIGIFGSRILIANLVIYLILRGFWIGVVGLTSAFPEGIRWPRLHYSETFRTYLLRKTPNTEALITGINRIGSSVFSFSFLLVFLVTAFFATLAPLTLFIATINTYFSSYPDDHWVTAVLRVMVPTLLIIYGSLALIFLVDFLTFGLIKRVAWKPLARVYFPIYRFFRWITLAPLYAPIYYTFITNVPRRILGLVLITYLGIFFFFNNYGYNEEIFFPTDNNASQLLNRYYEDQGEEPVAALFPMIPSEYVDHEYLRLFLPYLVTDNDSLRRICPETAIFREPGLTTDAPIRLDVSSSAEADVRTGSDEKARIALRCLAEQYEVYLNDSLCRPSVYYFYRHEPSGQPGLITYLSLASLPPGPQLLRVKKRDYGDNTPAAYEHHYIPFVKE